MPTARSVFSTFWASAGIKIFTAASPKKPSFFAKDSILRLRPLLRACLIPNEASLFDNEARGFDLFEPVVEELAVDEFVFFVLSV
ncbi:hypothetical protein D3C81_2120180 [compost metagenome]